MMDRPTLNALRSQVQKDRHQEIGSWLARRVARPSAVYGTWVAVRLGLSAHMVTTAALLASLSGSIAIALGTRGGFLAGVALAHLAYWLDHVDGQVARWRRTASLDGVYLDYLMHHAMNLGLGFALGYGLAERTGDPRWAVGGFAIAFGWAGLNLHNDCRYKAFFQRLKTETRTFRVDGGRGGRPLPFPPRPRKGLKAFTWFAYKACEPQNVLIGLTILASIGVFAPDWWFFLWRLGVRGMAVTAPALALARAGLCVKRRSSETEFARWFQPWEPSAVAHWERDRPTASP
ncbi:MAG: hypothetical protein NVSMB9_08900 [Isosphaeraceae bacterium]